MVKADYELRATVYDRTRFGTLGGQHVNKQEQNLVTRFIKGSCALEVGTATGRFAEVLTKKGAEYIGVDLSRKMLRATDVRINHLGSLVQMDGCALGLRSYFDYVLCVRTFHFLPKPTEALRGMFEALKPTGHCLITFETDNFLRRVLLFLGIGTSEQYYYKISDVQPMLERVGFKVTQGGSVMRIPVTFYRKTPGLFLPILKRLDRMWPWPMHQYVLATR